MATSLTPISSGYNLSAINTNFQRIQDALNNDVLWKTGNVPGETLMERDLDMNGNLILNVGMDINNPNSLLTIGQADARYYNITGDTLQGVLNAAGFRLTNVGSPLQSSDAARKGDVDAEAAIRAEALGQYNAILQSEIENRIAADVAEAKARQNADANLQSQISGGTPLEASSFSPISWHEQEIDNSVTIPANRNAWSFGPQMEIAEGQAVTIGEGSTWTIADGRVVENEDLHNLIADTITTANGDVTLDVGQIATAASLNTLTSRVEGVETANTALASRMSAEEGKTQSVNQGGTGATTPTAARSNLGAAASGANTDITSITGSAAKLTTSRTFQTNLASTAATGFDGSGNNTHGVTGTLPIANGGTGGTTAAAARTSLGAFPLAGVTDASNATAGNVGELLSNTATSVAISSATPTNVTSLVLTAGDWDLTGAVAVRPTGATVTQIIGGPSTVSVTNPSFPNRIVNNGSFTTVQEYALPTQRFNVTTSTTVYLVVTTAFTGGTATADGFLRARRIR